MSYMNRVVSIVLLAVLISTAPDALSKVKFYKSDSDMPFVEMMVAMMVAMGVLDRVPPQFISPTYLRATGNPYSRYSALGLGLYPASLGGVSPLYSGVGALPLYSGIGSSPSYKQSLLGYPRHSPVKSYQYDKPFSKHYFSGNKFERKSVARPRASGLYAEGFSKSALNGLWMSDFGELLAIKNGRFFWTNGQDNYMHGVMEITTDHVVASIERSNKVITYQYKIKGDTLITRDKTGKVRIFTLMDVGPDS